MKQDEQGESRESQGKFLCEHCGADTHEDTVKAAFWGERGLIAIEDIPARVCEGCAEQFYDEETARKIERIISDPARQPKREIRVRVFSLADLEVPNEDRRPPGEVEERKEM